MVSQVLLSIVTYAQQNLVPNPSFEESIQCPSGSGEIELANDWIEIRGSVDYFNECGTNGYGTPMNVLGNQLPNSGLAYSGFVPWALDINNAREYVGIQLIEPLSPMKRYRFSIYLNLADTVGYAVKEIAAAFTSGQPDNNQVQLFALERLVDFGNSDFIESQDDWMHLSGYYVAEGGEDFLTIGNFLKDIDTEIIRVSEQGTASSYYYIDDVSLVEDTSWHVGMGEEILGLNILSVYPNPNNGSFEVDVPELHKATAEMKLYGVSGKLVGDRRLNQGVNAIKFEAEDGLFLYVITLDNVIKWNGKISICR